MESKSKEVLLRPGIHGFVMILVGIALLAVTIWMFAKTGLADAPRLRRAYLDHLLDVKVIVRAARDAGIEAEAAYHAEADRVRRKLLLDAYAAHALFDTLSVGDADLRAFYERMNTRLTARYLYARTRAEAEALHARLRAGESFEALAEAVFTDSVISGLINRGLIQRPRNEVNLYHASRTPMDWPSSLTRPNSMYSSRFGS